MVNDKESDELYSEPRYDGMYCMIVWIVWCVRTVRNLHNSHQIQTAKFRKIHGTPNFITNNWHLSGSLASTWMTWVFYNSLENVHFRGTAFSSIKLLIVTADNCCFLIWFPLLDFFKHLGHFWAAPLRWVVIITLVFRTFEAVFF